MRFGYMRVSTEEQHLDRQRAMLEAEGVDRIFEEKITGKNLSRAKLNAMLEMVVEGDEIVVESISRISRSIRDLITLMDDLQHRGVKFRSLTEPFDTRTAVGEYMLMTFALLAQFERRIMLERQQAGIAAAKIRGAYQGRKKITPDTEEFAIVYALWRNGKIKTSSARKRLGLSEGTFRRRVKEWEDNNE